ncbi:hypothetical protein LNP00_03570 [Fructobacillus sp. M158]|uniref:hypothetical protein n=1 Tax=Fructobacillus parabroussonetiae TaxID=2713174 RepID=UPI002009F451|nr:hypothetical protein [Fructobacillus parabroussonetiae]MCK8617446.1 hypothetical protein [Fructobacillus parabroussonetiae]
MFINFAPFVLLIAFLGICGVFFIVRQIRFVTEINLYLQDLIDHTNIRTLDLRERPKQSIKNSFARHSLVYCIFLRPPYYLYGIINKKETYELIVFPFKENEEVAIITVPKDDQRYDKMLGELWVKRNKLLAIPSPVICHFYKQFMLAIDLSGDES